MDATERAQVHAALGERHRLAIVDELRLSDRTFHDLARLVDLPGNAAAHHLAVLESAGLVERRVSDGDHRRRYVTLRHDRLKGLGVQTAILPAAVLFVCTHNSARSQFAAALWGKRTGGTAQSAGTDPARRVHPEAVRAAATFDLDLRGAIPKGYHEISDPPDLIVSVCDRAHEAAMPFRAPSLHWSVADPVTSGTRAAFQSAFAEIAGRIDRLAEAVPH